MPTSSSSSSYSSQTSSSSSKLFSSSSSSGYCKTPDCVGQYCSNFSSWVINGIRDSYQGSIVYVLITKFGLEQQVELYSDPNYYNLIAVGKRSSSGTISLLERNSSGVSGQVQWDGTLIDSGATLELYCEELSSTSSSSSIDSSSSESESSKSDTSSSSNCCVNPYHYGVADAYFSNWTINGMNDNNSTNCELFVGFDVVSGYQQVRIYKDALLYNLVAIGEALIDGDILLNQVGGSGLTGSVYWDGTKVYHPSVVYLSCFEFSSQSSSSSNSSSSSSSSSIDSSSSTSIDSSSSSKSSSSSSSSSSVDSSSTSSSSSRGTSSSTSKTSSSESSLSTQSLSSSSSIDSSSSSSESEGNVSSSSSSSVEAWNRGKPLLLATTSIKNQFVNNKISQSVFVNDLTYSVGRAYFYFYGPFGNPSGGKINIDVCYCLDNGHPSTIITSSSINADAITSEGWYAFDVNINGNTPANGYLSFVMYMEDMDEDNYVSWGYSSIENSKNKAWLLIDEAWQEHKNIERALRVVGEFEAFDLNNFRINSPASVQSTTLPSLGSNSASYTRTLLSNNAVSIQNPTAIVSMVVDASGSNGWSDRYGNRIQFTQKMIDKFHQFYPSTYYFDLVKFGALVLDAERFSAQIGQPASINLDLNTPSRTTYTFQVSGIYSVIAGNKYSINDIEFKILKGTTDSTVIYAMGELDPPITSGVLTITEGNGQGQIQFSSFSKATIADGVVAYGLKNLENNHTYSIGPLIIDSDVLDNVSLTNIDFFHNQNETPSYILSESGPSSQSYLDISCSSNSIFRKCLVATELPATTFEGNLSAGDTNITIGDGDIIGTNTKYDFTDGEFISSNHSITSKNGNVITISPPIYYEISSSQDRNSIIQQTSYTSSKTITGTTAKIMVKDNNVTKEVTFYLQTTNGFSIEWDFFPFSEWVYNNLFWLGETATLPFEAFDEEGDPMPDGLRLDLKVDENFNVGEDDVSAKNLVADATIGTDIIYVDSVEGIKKDDPFKITDGSNQSQDITISEIGSDANGVYVKTYETLLYTFQVSQSAKIEYQKNSGFDVNELLSSKSARVSVPLGIIDATPIQTGRNLDPSLLQSYDGLQTPYTETYESINGKKEYVRYSYHEVPTIDGFVNIRFLPITEDAFKSIDQKKKEAEKILRMVPPSKINTQLKKNSQDNQEPEEAGQTENEEKDYSIETPIYLYGGYAKSHMSSTATELKEKDFNGVTMPGDKTRPVTLPTRTYTVNPSIIIEGETGAIIGQQILKGIEVDFAAPITIKSYNKFNKQVYFWAWYPLIPSDDCPIEPSYKKYYLNGVCATGGSYTIDYLVCDRLSLIKSGNLKIRIFSNRTVDMDLAVDVFAEKESQPKAQKPTVKPSQFFVNPPSKFVQQEDGTVVEEKSKITSWRDRTLNNSASHTLSTDTYEAYTDAENWELAKQYEAYDFTIPIVNGRASLTIPTSDIPSLLMVEASYPFGNEMEVIRTDFVVIANPITVDPWTPEKAQPKTGKEIYEIGTNILWKYNVDGIIEDGTIVNLTPPEESNVDLSEITPSVSQTSNGWAGGIKIGPRTPIISKDDCLTEDQQIQIIVVSVEHSSGISTKVKRRFKWDAIYQPLPDIYFFLHCTTDGNTSWSDGQNNNGTLEIDLTSKTNRTLSVWTDTDFPIADEYKEAYKGPSQNMLDNPFLNNPDQYTQPMKGIPVIWGGEFGKDRLLGMEQENNQPTEIAVRQNLPVFSPASARWDGPKISLKILPLNKCVGDLAIVEAEINTYYMVKNPYANNEMSINTGYVTPSYPSLEDDGSGNTKITWEKPNAKYYEPLSIYVEVESYNNSSVDASNLYGNRLGYGDEPVDGNHSFVRNGINSVDVVATIAWKGKRITDSFVMNEGTEEEFKIDYPMPVVKFECGLCEETNCQKDEFGQCLKDPDTGIGIPIDHRGQWHNCLTVSEHPDFKLSSYVVNASISRTTKHQDGDNIHTHECVVDKDGNGITTKTIVLKGVVAEHSHNIAGHICNNVNGHIHETRTVAVVKLLPTKNINPTITVKATATYDPTDCEPYLEEAYVQNQNRKSFASARLGGYGIIKPGLVMDILAETGEGGLYQVDKESESEQDFVTFYTSKSVDDFEKGFSMATEIYYREYITTNDDGFPVVVPKQKVPDGTRVTFSFDTYRPPANILDDQSTGNTFVVSYEKERTCLFVRLKISACVDGQNITKNINMQIKSNLQWLPGYKSLIDEPTDDSLILQSGISKINSLGASQLYDAITLSAQRSLQFAKDNNIQNPKHIMFVLSDGDENTSTASLNQSISNVHFISGVNNTPSVNGILGSPHPTDMAIVKYIADQTKGFVFGTRDYEEQQVIDLTNSVVKDERFALNNGMYADVIELDTSSNIQNIKVANSEIISDSAILYRFRTSNDNIEWGLWSSWQDISIPFQININQNAKFIAYEVVLSGSANFESPLLKEGASITNQKPQSTIVYFNPVDLNCDNDEFLSSVHITHAGFIPDTSKVEYGISQGDTVDPDDFTSRTRGWIKANEYCSLLDRMNEVLQTEDYVNYTNPNGRWNENASIKIRKFNNNYPNGVDVNASEYTINPQEGLVSFYASQANNDLFVMDVELKPFFRLICKITNYGAESAHLDHIGLIYSVMKRMSRDNIRNNTSSSITT